ncbi:MAG TPA: DUF4917 family protein [Terriglobales bacterium]|jgi:hypothetical protein|nr:DUF4917 family protein [Terriglobales bacterium]
MAILGVDDTLVAWDKLQDIPWTGLLVGNGASCAVWGHFRYKSLYDQSRSDQMTNRLNAEAVHIFEALETHNFELVLSALKTTSLVNGAIGQDPAIAEGLYLVIQNALVEAVKSVHIPWANIPENNFRAIKESLIRYEFVYSTNYDLLLYWSIMLDEPLGFKDYFFGPRFDLGNTEIWDKVTKILFLHGGLHLYRALSGETIKRKAEPGQNLLDLFGTPLEQFAVPLFITEGSSRDKLNSIYRSDYLSFAYSQFAKHRGPLVIFGQSLNAQFDGHLIDAIKHSEAKDLGISLLPGAEVPANKARLHGAFPNINLHFFDATTHPMGAATLSVPEEQA